MKFILTGSTGFIGSEVLSQCLLSPKITSIIVLSRREIPKTHPKLKVVVMEDFNIYPESVMNEISGADACIWCMGTTKPNQLLEVDYPKALTEALISTLPSTSHPIRYIHLSGAATERDQAKDLWFKSTMRKQKGLTESILLDLPSNPDAKGLWSTLILKSGFVIQPTLKSPRDIAGWLLGPSTAIRVSELAAAMISAALNGWDGPSAETWSDVKSMGEKGREMLEQTRGKE